MRGGWVQGYNCQAVTSQDGLIIATSVGQQPSGPTDVRADDERRRADRPAPPRQRIPRRNRLLLADAGYLSRKQPHRPRTRAAHPRRKEPSTGNAARTAPADQPAPEDAAPIAAMTQRLRTPDGTTTYPPTGNAATSPRPPSGTPNTTSDSAVTGRGKTRASAEFTFHALVHNLTKAFTRIAKVPRMWTSNATPVLGSRFHDLTEAKEPVQHDHEPQRPRDTAERR